MNKTRSAIAIQLQYHYDCLLSGTIPLTPEPEGPFKTEEEEKWYDLFVSERKRRATTGGPTGPGGASTASQLTVTNAGYQNQQQVNNALLNIPLDRTLWVKSGSTLSPRKGDPNRPWSTVQTAHDAAAAGDVIRVTPGGTSTDSFGRAYYPENFTQSKNVRVVNEPGAIHGGQWLMGRYFGTSPFSYTVVGGEYLGNLLLCRQAGGKSKLLLDNVKFTGALTRVQGVMNNVGGQPHTDVIMLRNCYIDSDRTPGSDGPVRNNGRSEFGGCEIVLYDTFVTTTGSSCITFSSVETSWVTLLGSTELQPGAGYSTFQTLDTGQGLPAVPESTWLHDKRPGVLTAQAIVALTDSAASNVAATVTGDKLALNYTSSGTGTENGTASGEELDSLYVELDDVDFAKIPAYADGQTSGTPLYYRRPLKVSRIEDIVRNFVAGSSTPNASGAVKDNPYPPASHSFEWLRKQTFVAPAGLTDADLEYKLATATAWTAYPGPLDVPPGSPAQYFMCRVKETATRNPSASAYSGAFSSITTATNYQPGSTNTPAWRQGDGAHLDVKTSFDGTQTAERVRGYSYTIADLNAPSSSPVVNGQNYTISIAVKPFTDEGHPVTAMRINSFDNKFFARFDFVTGEITERSALAKTVSLQSLDSLGGNYIGWFMVQLGFEMQGNQAQFNFGWISPAESGYADVVVAQTQLNDGLFRTSPYLATT